MNDTPLSPHQVYEEAVKILPPEEVDHHGNGVGLDDLYLKVTPESKALIERVTDKSLISTFHSAIDGSLWYELPFCYPVKSGK